MRWMFKGQHTVQYGSACRLIWPYQRVRARKAWVRLSGL